MSRFHKSLMIYGSYRHVLDYCKINQGLSNQSRYFLSNHGNGESLPCCTSLLDHDSEGQWFREEVILMKILDPEILSLDQKTPCYQSKNWQTTFPQILRTPCSNNYWLSPKTYSLLLVQCIDLWFFVGYPATRLKTKFSSLSFMI